MKNEPIDNQVMKPVEVSKLLRVSVRTITRMAEEESIKAFKVRGSWRFQRADVVKFMEGCSVTADKE